MGNAPLTALKAPYPPPPHPLLTNGTGQDDSSPSPSSSQPSKQVTTQVTTNTTTTMRKDGEEEEEEKKQEDPPVCEHGNVSSTSRVAFSSFISPRRVSHGSSSLNSSSTSGGTQHRSIFGSVFSRSSSSRSGHGGGIGIQGGGKGHHEHGLQGHGHRSLLARFHHSHHHHHHDKHSPSSSSTSNKPKPLTNVEKFGCRHKPGVLLHGCQNLEEHSLKVREVLRKAKEGNLKGSMGLKEVGLEFRVVHVHALGEECDCRFAQWERARQHAENVGESRSEGEDEEEGESVQSNHKVTNQPQHASAAPCPTSPTNSSLHEASITTTTSSSSTTTSPQHNLTSTTATATSMAAAADSLCIRLSFDEWEEHTHHSATTTTTTSTNKPPSPSRLAVTNEETPGELQNQNQDEDASVSTSTAALSLEESSVSCRSSSYASSTNVSLGMLLGSVSECESEVTAISACSTAAAGERHTTTTKTTTTSTTTSTTLNRSTSTSTSTTTRRKKLHYHRHGLTHAHTAHAPWNHYHKKECVRRLFHTDSNTLITEENRRQFVADGDMYEVVTDWCQEYAHECMLKEGGLKWVTICKDATQGEPIRAMVDAMDLPFMAKPTTSALDGHGNDNDPSNDNDNGNEKDPGKKTLLIVTGKGKVRAGIFSRKHLLVTGLEPSTALPLIHQARQRHMHVAIFDPNARGDRNGMDTFEASMERVFVHQNTTPTPEEEEEGASPTGGESPCPCHEDVVTEGTSDTCFTDEDSAASDAAAVVKEEHGLYVLAHSASGAQLVRYLLDKQLEARPMHENGASSLVVSNASSAPSPSISLNPLSERLPLTSTPSFRIEAIAFTDSTHNIQWTKQNPQLRPLLESTNSIYVRSAHAHDSQAEEWHEEQTGSLVQTDERWRHRFGEVKTLWAGTKMHELINWTARESIWSHFDGLRG